MKCRKKSPVADAYQWNGKAEHANDLILDLKLDSICLHFNEKKDVVTSWWIKTPGQTQVRSGDWIVINGSEVSVVREDDFNELYEEVKE